jgi:hypothetical protein
MRRLSAVRARVVIFVIFLFSSPVFAQSSGPVSAPSVPHLIKIGGVFHPADGQPAGAVETVTLAIYAEPEGGVPLWQETQTIALDAQGHYTVLLGAMQDGGIPAAVFGAGEAQWLGTRFERGGEVEGPRIRLASVPYAFKAQDAETLGGHPASDYALTPSAKDHAGATKGAATKGEAAAPVTANVVLPGTLNFLAKYATATDVGPSGVFETAGGAVGIGTQTPNDVFHVRFTNTAGTATGLAVQNLGNTGAAYSGMLFYDQFGALGQFQGFSNITHEYRINNIAKVTPGGAFNGSINFMIGNTSRFLVASNGNVGIGVSVPASPLDVAGDVNLTGVVRLAGKPVLQIPAAGSGNFGAGPSALGGNANIGDWNTAIGSNALYMNTGGTDNIALGSGALASNTTGGDNTAIGAFAANHNQTGFTNTAIGNWALVWTTTGSGNIAIGHDAGYSLTGAESNNIEIGNQGTVGESGTIRIGTPATQTKFFAAGIAGVQTGNNDAVPVLIDSAGQLGVVNSSRRFKEDIQDMGEASQRLMQLRPVTFRYRQAFADGSKPTQFGLIAEEVAETFPELAVRDANGTIQSVHYERLNVLLLNEFQRQQRQMLDLQEELRALRRQLDSTRDRRDQRSSRSAARAAASSAGRARQPAPAAPGRPAAFRADRSSHKSDAPDHRNGA